MIVHIVYINPALLSTVICVDVKLKRIWSLKTGSAALPETFVFRLVFVLQWISGRKSTTPLQEAFTGNMYHTFSELLLIPAARNVVEPKLFLTIRLFDQSSPDPDWQNLKSESTRYDPGLQHWSTLPMRFGTGMSKYCYMYHGFPCGIRSLKHHQIAVQYLNST